MRISCACSVGLGASAPHPRSNPPWRCLRLRSAGPSYTMAAAYAFHIAQNQPFDDGNKRTALNAALVFLYLNGWKVSDPEIALYDAMIAFATHSLDKEGFGRLLQSLAERNGDETEP